MTRDERRQTVLRVLGEIAPEIDPAQVKDHVPFREQLDLDSMDFLRFVVALGKEVGVEIPEADYPKLTTLGAWLDYLASRV
ncbi:MAG: acyl carrier protein [Myxococcota bacterium]